MGGVLRPWEFYSDKNGRSDAEAQIAQIHRDDQRKGRLIVKKISLLEQMDLKDAVQTKLIKRASAVIFVLRVNSGRFASFRLPFFESPCSKEPTLIFTDCVSRPLLDRRGAYGALVAKAEERRLDWITRNCRGR
jgi:hypothetical protein